MRIFLTSFRLMLCVSLFWIFPLAHLYGQTDESGESVTQEEASDSTKDSEEKAANQPETKSGGTMETEPDRASEAGGKTAREKDPAEEKSGATKPPDSPSVSTGEGDTTPRQIIRTEPQPASESPPSKTPSPAPPEPVPPRRTLKANGPEIQAEETLKPSPAHGESEPVTKPSTPETSALPTEAPEESGDLSHEITAFVKNLSPWKILLILSILVLIYFLNTAVTLYFGRLSAKRAEYSQWFKKGIPFITFALWVITFFLIAILVAPTRVTTVLLIGILIAMGVFASHQLMRDFIAGVMILLERPFQIGDRIQIGDHYGEVVRIGLRSFHLRSPEGSLVVIPNGETMANAVSNVNPGTMEGQVVTELYMPSELEIDEARRIAFEAAAVSPYVFIHKPIEVHVDEEYKERLLIKVIVKAFVFDAKYENDLRSDIVELARKGFRKRQGPGEDHSAGRATPGETVTGPMEKRG